LRDDTVAEASTGRTLFALLEAVEVRVIATEDGSGLLLTLKTEDLDDNRRTEGLVLMREHAEDLARQLLLGLAKLERAGRDENHILLPPWDDDAGEMMH
jgi:hypothetical protein